MNLILLTPEDFISDNRASLTDHRAKHIFEIHKAEPGRQLKVGMVGGLIGQGTVDAIDQTEDGHQAELLVAFSLQPPEKLPLTVVLALPRPKMLRRIIQNLAALGVQHLVLINSYRVEKSYWQSPFLNQLDDYVQLGLEQAVDTVPMTIQLEKRFKPFVEDRLPELVAGQKAIVAHPYVEHECPRNIDEPLVMAIGPEGGFIEYEVNKLVEAGFLPVTLGSRIQKVETVLTQLIGRLY